MRKLLPLVLVLFACNVFGESKEIAEIRKLAEAGDAAAQHNLGELFYDAKDFKESFKWFHKAAKLGHAKAQHMLGLMYNHSIGVPFDVKEAAKWYRKAAEQGHWEAQWYLGYAYHTGSGVPKDYVAAYAWYNLADYNGYTQGAKARDILAKKMLSEQIAKAQELSKELLKKIEAKKALEEFRKSIKRTPR